jgi:hypothetical protein
LRVRDTGPCDDDKQCDAMTPDGLRFVGFVANALVVGNRNPAFGAAIFQPLLVGAARWKQVMMPLDRQARGGKNGGELLSEVPVCEVDAAQAARSYRTASSISSGRRS